jgi:hypothetical protein
MAQEYGVSYPMVRARLDRHTAQVRAAEDPTVGDPFERTFRPLAGGRRQTHGIPLSSWTCFF